MRVLVTGGMGFIGSHLCHRLLVEGHEVGIIDPQKNYSRVPTSEYEFNLNERKRLLNTGVQVTTHALGERRSEIKDTLQSFGATHVVHLAANPLADLVEKDPEQGRRDIVLSTQELLEGLEGTKSIRRFIYISSSMVYGDFINEKAKEDDLLRPLNHYGRFKLEAEDLVRSHCGKTGWEFVILRPTAVYGPNDNNARVVQKMIHSALNTHKLTVRGPEERLDFTHVSDVVEGIYLSLKSSEASGHTFNIAFGQSRSLTELAQIIADLVPGTEIVFTERDQRLPRRGSMCIQKARSILGFCPRVDLKSGVHQYANYLFTQRKILQDQSSQHQFKPLGLLKRTVDQKRASVSTAVVSASRNGT